jgi:hypothetical protein
MKKLSFLLNVILVVFITMGGMSTNSFANSRSELEDLKTSQSILMDCLEREATIGLIGQEKEQRLKEIKEEVSLEGIRINESRSGIKYFKNLIMTKYNVSEQEAFAIFQSNDERVQTTYDYMIQNIITESIENVLLRVSLNNAKGGERESIK